jgi:hypothetical protein
MRPLALAALLLATPAAAQQYWLPNGPGGTTSNNPQGSLLGTMNEHMLQRHMQQRQWESGRQGVSGGPTRQAARSVDPSFRLGNGGAVTMREAYVSSSNDHSWGPDRLGQNVLQPGQRFVIQLPAGQCVNDVRVVFMDGSAIERRRIDTCALADLQLP